jgi:hypothetical protein
MRGMTAVRCKVMMRRSTTRTRVEAVTAENPRSCILGAPIQRGVRRN